MTVYVKKEPWPAISEAVRATKGRVVAASGYVNNGAFERLPLKAGDVLVCDVSPATVATGGSNPRALLPFLKAGVKVFSKPGLHAKVVVLPRRAFVGSANASDYSANRLFEAVMETSDTSDIRALRRFVEDLCTSPVDSKSVQALCDKYPKRPKNGAAATDPSRLPDKWDKVTLVGLSAGYWSKQEWKAWEGGKKAAKDKARNSFTGYTITEFSWDTGEGASFDEGRWVIQVVDDVPQAPGVVVHRKNFASSEVIWLATPVEARALPSVGDLRSGSLLAGEIRSVSGKTAQRLLDLHRARIAD